MAKFADTGCSYTQSFLQQLQTEWKEFWFEVGHCELAENAPSSSVRAAERKHDVRENLVESLNKFNSTCDGNIVIPVPLKTLKRLFSPSKCNADDVFKVEFFNEIKDNLNLTTKTCNQLQKLLLSESDLEVSDFPTPSILTSNQRKSAPARLVNKKKIKSRQLFDKNDLVLKVAKNTENAADKENAPRNTNAVVAKPDDKNNRLNDIIRNIIDDSDENVHVTSTQRRNVLQTIDRNIIAAGSANINTNNNKNSTPKPKPPPVEADRRKLLSIKKTKRTRNTKEQRDQADDDDARPRYSSVYDLKLDSRDSSGLFITGRSQKKQAKPTIVCTYFNQSELEKIYQTVKKLGFFEIENSVSARTTHLICGSSKKTVNLCKAVARGCWILDKEWIFSSCSEKRWLYEERFEKYDLSPAVKENRIKRQKFGPVYRCNIFTNCGAMFVSPSCAHPKTDDIKELIMLGGGRITDNAAKAKHIVGHVAQRECLKETWILSSIMQGQVLNITSHFKIT
ncbi:uncharacterized protein MCPH1 [Planococcus citri]|uniref:uncharacterized protein MCPH1 n=1 Tax=Planococcus citri TaxID=170843 RepID=UPI0031F97538